MRSGVHRAASAACFSLWVSLQHSFNNTHTHSPFIAPANVHWTGYMFKSCTTLRKHVNLIPGPSSGTLPQQFQLPWKHISWTKALLRNQSSFDRPALREKQEEHEDLQLQPVPRFINALWKPFQHQIIQAEKRVNVGSERYSNGGLNPGRSWLERHIRLGLDVALHNRGGGHQLLAETWKQTAPTKTSIGFNAVAARLQRLGLRLGSRHILYGMTKATSPAAMKQYLLMLERSKSDDPLLVEDYTETFMYIAKQLCLTPRQHPGQRTLGSSEWSFYRRQEQWINVITGLTEDTLDQPQQTRQFSLYDLGPRNTSDCWAMYIDLLRVFVGESAVYHEFLRFKRVQQQAKTPTNQSVDPDLNIAKHLLNVTVREIAKGNLRLAYEVAQQHMDGLGDIERSTWQVLLVDLDLFHTWGPKISPKAFNAIIRRFNDRIAHIDDQMPYMMALSELEYELQKVELQLGVRCSGGEGGYHELSQS